MPADTNILKSNMKAISEKFYENVYALRIFNEEIGKLAEEHDKFTKSKYFCDLVGLLGISEEELFSVSKGSELKIYYKNAEDKHLSNLLTQKCALYLSKHENQEERISISLPIEKNVIKLKIIDFEKLYEIFYFLEKSKLYTPKQSKLLRQGAIINLVSYFEALMVDLLQFFYSKYPAALPAEGKVISLAELREIGSIDEAERILINKEIDGLLRDTTEAQIEYFSKRPKVDLSCVNSYFNDLLEIIQRRNILVHNDGIINKIYMNKIGSKYAKQNNIQEGDKVKIDGEYLSRAIDIICIVGTMLIQQAWRKWDSNNLELADQILREYSYDLLLEKRWTVVEKIARYASDLKFYSDSSARIIVVNHAIALKEQNRTEEMETLLCEKDWSSCSFKFKVALPALREEYNVMVQLLGKAVIAGEIKRQEVEEWPLFKWFRESNYYEASMKKIFEK